MAKRKSIKQQKFSPKHLLVTALIFGLVGGFVGWAAFAAPHNGGGGGGGGKGGSYTGSLSMVMLTDVNGDGSPNWNDQITFKVTSTAAYPMVNLNCVQGTTMVDDQNVGFYPGWPWSQTYTLSHWYYWTSGAADCKATLYYQGTNGNVTLSTLNFHVNA
jgi:hypothetical protein